MRRSRPIQKDDRVRFIRPDRNAGAAHARVIKLADPKDPDRRLALLTRGESSLDVVPTSEVQLDVEPWRIALGVVGIIALLPALLFGAISAFLLFFAFYDSAAGLPDAVNVQDLALPSNRTFLVVSAVLVVTAVLVEWVAVRKHAFRF